MRFLYLSRNFNRSGFLILAHLLERGRHRPMGVVLPSDDRANPLDDKDPEMVAAERRRYVAETERLGGPALRFMESIRRLADDAGVPVHDRRTLKGRKAKEWMAELAPDLVVLGGGWPQLLPEKLLADLPLGTINTHPSLLPEYRGTDVHRWQVADGVRRSGTTIHYVDATFDTGAILGSVGVDVDRADTPQEIALKAGTAAGPLMQSVLDRIAEAAPGRADGAAQPGRQDATLYHSKWRWDDPEFLRLDLSRPADELARFILACTQEWYGYEGPWLRTTDGRRWIVRRATALPARQTADPGAAVVECGQGRLLLQVVQEAGELTPHTIPSISGAAWASLAHRGKPQRDPPVAGGAPPR